LMEGKCNYQKICNIKTPQRARQKGYLLIRR